jgi:GNAT superfamily N-acetyltransferase
VGYAELERRTADVLGHELAAVASTHRRRGIGRALKRAQIAWAAGEGFRRLLTDTHWANEATRRLNESLGRPLPPKLMVRKELS